MYFLLTQLLFWFYWAISAMAIVLIVRELLRESSLILQVTAALALIPLVLRVLLLK